MKQQKTAQLFLGLLSFGLVTSIVEIDNAFALDLTSPFMPETAQVLPAGVRSPRFINVFISADQKFGGGMQAEPLGQPLQKLVEWNEVIRLQKSEIDKGAIRSTLKDVNLDISGNAGSTTGQVNAYFNIKVPALAYGVTDRLTFALAVPVMDVSVSADTGFVRSEEGQKWMNKLCSVSVAECNKAAKKMNNSVNEKLTDPDYGYEPIQNMNYTKVGDIQFVGKYLLYKEPRNLLALKSTVVFPTGTEPNVNRALDIPTGDGRYQLGTSLVYDRFFSHDFRWNTYSGLMALMPNQMERRVPTSGSDPLSQDKEMLTRNMGAHISMGTAFFYTIPSIGLVTGAGYHFQFLTRTSYSGGALPDQNRYRYLEDLTPSEILHSTTLTAGFSTVEWFQNKKFVYPFQANLVFSHPISGRNTSTSNVYAGELVMFF